MALEVRTNSSSEVSWRRASKATAVEKAPNLLKISIEQFAEAYGTVKFTAKKVNGIIKFTASTPAELPKQIKQLLDSLTRQFEASINNSLKRKYYDVVCGKKVR